MRNTGKCGAVTRKTFLSTVFLHTRELLLRYLFLNIDDATTGSASYTGTIGKQLEACEKHLIMKYIKVYGILKDFCNFKDQSSDQRY